MQGNIPITHGSIGSECFDQMSVLFRRTAMDKYCRFFGIKTNKKNMLPRMSEARKKAEGYFR